MIEGTYFDGQTTLRQPVVLVLHKRIVAMRGDNIKQQHRLSQSKVSERLDNAPRIIYFPDGGCVHIGDRKLDAMLAENGYREPRAVQWQRNWPRSLAALVALIVTLLSAYQWGVPLAADVLARHLPNSLEQALGDQGLEIIDRHYMKPSRLDRADQLRLRKLFSEMRQPRRDKTVYRLEFRSSESGPNAFALPNGVIVMTDQLVMLARNDHAVLGVLSHELGHLKHRHTLRGMMQALGAGLLINLWIGDVSSALAILPTVLLERKYSRDFEREADQYAIDMMRGNHMPLEPMAVLFEKMHAVSTAVEPPRRKEEDDESERRNDGQGKPRPDKRNMLEYFSTHPTDQERIAKLRAGDKR